MDGRDIGTVVLPSADLKVFLTASPEERAHRRHRELLARGENVSYREVYESIQKRDALDSSSEVSPLRKAEDAVEIDYDGAVRRRGRPGDRRPLCRERRDCVLYVIGRVLFRALFRLVFRYRVEGREDPKERWRPSRRQPCELPRSSPLGKRASRPVHFMAKAELFKLPRSCPGHCPG